MTKITLKERIINVIKSYGRPATIDEISQEIPDKPQSTIRGRLNENVNVIFQRVARGVYWFVKDGTGIVLVEGDGRDLSMFEDETDGIVTDHPWQDQSTKGGNRNFTSSYETFRYTLEDFQEKARVLKNGGYLVEVIPAENEMNFRYLFQLKDWAEKCGLRYYAKVNWIKGDKFISNTGRKSKNSEEVIFFSKGPARKLRIDQKKTKKTGVVHYMSGTTKMLPTEFNVPIVPVSERSHQAEKPISLYEQIIELISLPGELIIDQFAGSGNLGIAAARTNRFAVLFETCKDSVIKMKNRFTSMNYEFLNL